jgi:hypothetical protein
MLVVRKRFTVVMSALTCYTGVVTLSLIRPSLIFVAKASSNLIKADPVSPHFRAGSYPCQQTLLWSANFNCDKSAASFCHLVAKWVSYVL